MAGGRCPRRGRGGRRRCFRPHACLDVARLIASGSGRRRSCVAQARARRRPRQHRHRPSIAGHGRAGAARQKRANAIDDRTEGHGSESTSSAGGRSDRGTGVRCASSQVAASGRPAHLRGDSPLAGDAGGRVRVQPAGCSGDDGSRSPGSDAGVRAGSFRLPPARLPELRALTAAPPAASTSPAQANPGMSPGTLARGPIDARMAQPRPPTASTAHTIASHVLPRRATATAASATKMP